MFQEYGYTLIVNLATLCPSLYQLLFSCIQLLSHRDDSTPAMYIIPETVTSEATVFLVCTSHISLRSAEDTVETDWLICIFIDSESEDPG